MNLDAVESELFPGYHHVPGNERLIINRSGQVIDLRMMASILESPANHDYATVNIMGQGSVHIHRLMAMVFLRPRGDPKNSK